MSDSASRAEHVEVSVTREGRVLIPAPIRHELGIKSGATLTVYVEDGRVVMESRQQLINRMRREIAAAWQGDPNDSVADELITERRAEAAVEGVS